MKKVKNIIILGGGTSGWLTAAYMIKNLKIPASITLIEDSDIGPIGVGEGTQPFTTKFLYNCGIPAEEWMKVAQASFKLGVEMKGWVAEDYFVDNDANYNVMLSENLYTSDYFLDKTNEELNAWHPAYRLAKANKSPKWSEHHDANLGSGQESFGAVHFSAQGIVDAIKKIVLDKITYVDTRIETINQDEDGISNLISADGTTYSADLYIDCTGFASVLIEKQLKSSWTSYSQYLPVDRAVVIPSEYSDPEKECHPYTKATTMTAGWMFTIPIMTRIGSGYIYSSKHISDEDAEKELRSVITHSDAPARIIHLKSGTHKEIARKNVVAVGLSAGFIEPLEATAITFTTTSVSAICELLNNNTMLWNDRCRQTINWLFGEMVNEIMAFVWCHYYFSTRNDTLFWQDIRKQRIEDLPPEAQKFLPYFLPRPGKFIYAGRGSMFNVFQWFRVIHAGGGYKGQSANLTEEERGYCEYALDSISARVTLAKDRFMNHYKYLEKWYAKKIIN
jgi:tryptophan halogenase